MSRVLREAIARIDRQQLFPGLREAENRREKLNSENDLNASTISELDGCVERMKDKSLDDVSEALNSIISTAMSRSPEPEELENCLQSYVRNCLCVHVISTIEKAVEAEASENEISVIITSSMVKIAVHRPPYYDVAFQFMKGLIEARFRDRSGPWKNALERVQKSIPQFVANHNAKVTSAIEMNPSIRNALLLLEPGEVGKDWPEQSPIWYLCGFLNGTEEPATFRDTVSRMFVEGYILTHLNPDNVMKYFESVDMLFDAFAKSYRPEVFYFHSWIKRTDLIELRTRLMTGIAEYSPVQLVNGLAASGCCPAFTVMAVFRRLAIEIRQNWQSAKASLLTLGNFGGGRFMGDDKTWLKTFKSLMSAGLEVFAGMLLVIQSRFKKYGNHAAIDLTRLLTLHISMTEDPDQCTINMKVYRAFIAWTVVDWKSTDNAVHLEQSLSQYAELCDKADYRCLADHPCQHKWKALVSDPKRIAKMSKNVRYKQDSSSIFSVEPRRMDTRWPTTMFVEVAETMAAKGESKLQIQMAQIRIALQQLLSLQEYWKKQEKLELCLPQRWLADLTTRVVTDLLTMTPTEHSLTLAKTEGRTFLDPPGTKLKMAEPNVEECECGMQALRLEARESLRGFQRSRRRSWNTSIKNPQDFIDLLDAKAVTFEKEAKLKAEAIAEGKPKNTPTPLSNDQWLKLKSRLEKAAKKKSANLTDNDREAMEKIKNQFETANDKDKKNPQDTSRVVWLANMIFPAYPELIYIVSKKNNYPDLDHWFKNLPEKYRDLF